MLANQSQCCEKKVFWEKKKKSFQPLLTAVKNTGSPFLYPIVPIPMPFYDFFGHPYQETDVFLKVVTNIVVFFKTQANFN